MSNLRRLRLRLPDDAPGIDSELLKMLNERFLQLEEHTAAQAGLGGSLISAGADIDMKGHRLRNVGNPKGPGDAASAGHVMNVASASAQQTLLQNYLLDVTATDGADELFNDAAPAVPQNLTLAWKKKAGWLARWEPPVNVVKVVGYYVSYFNDNAGTVWMHPETGQVVATETLAERFVETTHYTTNVSVADLAAPFSATGVKVRVTALVKIKGQGRLRGKALNYGSLVTLGGDTGNDDAAAGAVVGLSLVWGAKKKGYKGTWQPPATNFNSIKGYWCVFFNTGETHYMNPETGQVAGVDTETGARVFITDTRITTNLEASQVDAVNFPGGVKLRVWAVNRVNGADTEGTKTATGLVSVGGGEPVGSDTANAVPDPPPAPAIFPRTDAVKVKCAIPTSQFNLFVNNKIAFKVKDVANATLGYLKDNPLTITAASNATPVVITTSAAHGLVTGDIVAVRKVKGNAGANGTWTITFVSSTTFSLGGSVGDGAYTSGGVVRTTSITATETFNDLGPDLTHLYNFRRADLVAMLPTATTIDIYNRITNGFGTTSSSTAATLIIDTWEEFLSTAGRDAVRTIDVDAIGLPAFNLVNNGDFLFSSGAAATLGGGWRKWPSAIATSTTLNGAINNSVTTITLTSGTGFPTGSPVTIGSEKILLGTKAAAVYTGCTRGFSGTTAASHADLAPVTLNPNVGTNSVVITDAGASVYWVKASHRLIWDNNGGGHHAVVYNLEHRLLPGDYISVSAFLKSSSTISPTVSISLLRGDSSDIDDTEALPSPILAIDAGVYKRAIWTLRLATTALASADHWLVVDTAYALDVTHDIEIDRVMIVRGQNWAPYSPQAYTELNGASAGVAVVGNAAGAMAGFQNPDNTPIAITQPDVVNPTGSPDSVTGFTPGGGIGPGFGRIY